MNFALIGVHSLLSPLQHMTRGFLPAQALQARRTPPLRVARVLEERRPRHSAGRMVISGRIDDVCAELDRLVERENRS